MNCCMSTDGGTWTNRLTFEPDPDYTFSTNPSHRRFLLPTGLTAINVLFIPCGRLSWLLVSFLLHVKYTLSYISYRIVRMPEPDCFLRYHFSAATRNFTSGKSDVCVGLYWPLQRGVLLTWFYSVSRRNTFVGGKCAPPSALLVHYCFCVAIMVLTQWWWRWWWWCVRRRQLNNNATI